MAMAARLRSGLPLLRCAERSVACRAVLIPDSTNSEFRRNYVSAAAPPAKEQKVKVPMTLFGVTGNYASALYLASVKANALDKVESELLPFLEASKKSPAFTQFMKDLSVKVDTRVKALTDICAEAKFSDITKNFLLVVAEGGRLGLLDQIVRSFRDLTMAHRGEVQVSVTTVIALPPEEEKELIETLQDMLGRGKTVIVEQKIDPSILGGLVVEFGQKVFDMSIRTRALQMERFLREPVTLDA